MISLIQIGDLATWVGALASLFLGAIAVWPRIRRQLSCPILSFELHENNPFEMTRLHPQMYPGSSTYLMLYGKVKNAGWGRVEDCSLLMHGLIYHDKKSKTPFPVGIPLNWTNRNESQISIYKEAVVDFGEFVGIKEGQFYFKPHLTIYPNNFQGFIAESSKVEIFFEISCHDIKRNVFFSVKCEFGNHSKTQLNLFNSSKFQICYGNKI